MEIIQSSIFKNTSLWHNLVLSYNQVLSFLCIFVSSSANLVSFPEFFLASDVFLFLHHPNSILFHNFSVCFSVFYLKSQYTQCCKPKMLINWTLQKLQMPVRYIVTSILALYQEVISVLVCEYFMYFKFRFVSRSHFSIILHLFICFKDY